MALIAAGFGLIIPKTARLAALPTGGMIFVWFVVLAMVKADPFTATTKVPHGYTLLYHATISGVLAMVEGIKPLLPAGAKDFTQALGAAKRARKAEMANCLLANGAAQTWVAGRTHTASMHGALALRETISAISGRSFANPSTMRISCVGLTRLFFLVACLSTPALARAAAAAPASLDPTTLVTKEDVAVLTGQPVIEVAASPAETDPDTGGMLAYCSFRSASSEVIVAVVTFASPTEAGTKMTREFAAQFQADEKPNVVAESDLGERAFWVTTERAAEYIVLKGARVLAIGIGGRTPKPMMSYRDALRTLAQKAAAKM